MRLITLALAALLLLIQVAATRAKTEQLKARNAKLESEVRDLKDGLGAVEERARYELGMIKSNEIFVQVLRKDEKPAVMMTEPPPPSATKVTKDGRKD
jgi:cell division protein FtsB